MIQLDRYSYPRTIAVDVATDRVYVGQESDVAVIDGATGLVLAEKAVGTAVVSLAVDSAVKRLVTAQLTSTATLSTTDNKIVSSIIFNAWAIPNGVAVNPTTHRVYLADRWANRLIAFPITLAGSMRGDFFFDPTKASPLNNIRVGQTPQGIAVNPALNRIYVANQGDSTVSVIDGATDTLTSAIPIPGGAAAVAINAATNRIYVAGGDDRSGALTMLDGLSDAVLAVAPLDSLPLGLAVNPATDRVFVTTENGGRVFSFDGSTLAPLSSLPDDSGTAGLAVNPRTSIVYVANRGDDTVWAFADCRFTLGFASLAALIPDTVGRCTENESHNPTNGDALQNTTGGLLVWRKADNWTAFTDGYWTWVNGPNGVQRRLNSQRFPWEENSGGLPLAS